MKSESASQTTHGIHLAAGGIAWRRGSSGEDEIAVVRRARYHDWALPKGKPEGAEALDTTALREAQEETGCRLTLGRFLGSYAYVSDAPKTVLIWEMAFVSDGFPQAADEDEVLDRAWLPPAEVIRRLTHEAERHLVERWAGLPATHEECHPPQEEVPPSKLERLAAALQTATERLEAITSRAAHQTNAWWAACARRSLAKAALALHEHSLERGWGAVHDAERFMVFGASDRELVARALSLQAETTAKLKGWRSTAAAALFKEVALGDFSKPTVALTGEQRTALQCMVVEALSVLNEDSNNSYHRMRLVGEQLRTMVLWCAGILLAALALSFIAEPDSPFHVTMIFPILLAGGLGGVVSAMMQLARVGESKIPEALLHGLITSGRPLVGAASALFVYLVLRSNLVALIDSENVELEAGLVLGFVAGFAEQLVLNTVAKLSGTREAQDKPAGQK